MFRIQAIRDTYVKKSTPPNSYSYTKKAVHRQTYLSGRII